MSGSDLLLWMPWALLLSAAGLVVAVRSYRHGDGVGALRWVGWALVPPALLLTGTLRLVGRVGAAVLDWSVSLAFTPTTWVGIALGGTAAVLLGVARRLRPRRGRRSEIADSGGDAPAGSPGRGRSGHPGAGTDDDLADVQDILRQRRIN